jgi:lipopolysaccharide/colanic/teichoic acid biosynthesis glycosyltransferase
MLITCKKHVSNEKESVSHSPNHQIRMTNKIHPKAYFHWKEPIERLLAALLLIPGLPIIGIIWILVRLCSPGPGIYRQVRVGKNAKVFTMFKLRTMRIDAEQGRAIWSTSNDPRVTRLGRILRKLHLDELPQLFNVVKGEMSLIGPRPERPEIVVGLTEKIPGYLDRLVILPGVTGLAQINLPPDSTLDDVRRKLVLDKEYVEEAGIWLDTRILMSTMVRLLGLPGFLAMHLFRLHRVPPCIAHLIPAESCPKDSTDFVSTSHEIPRSHTSDKSDSTAKNHKQKHHGASKQRRQPTLKPR